MQDYQSKIIKSGDLVYVKPSLYDKDNVWNLISTDDHVLLDFHIFMKAAMFFKENQKEDITISTIPNLGLVSFKEEEFKIPAMFIKEINLKELFGEIITVDHDNKLNCLIYFKGSCYLVPATYLILIDEY